MAVASACSPCYLQVLLQQMNYFSHLIFLHIELLISTLALDLFQQQSEVGKGQCWHGHENFLTVQCCARYPTLVVKDPTWHMYDL